MYLLNITLTTLRDTLPANENSLMTGNSTPANSHQLQSTKPQAMPHNTELGRKGLAKV
jgi:hypothetical protein